MKVGDYVIFTGTNVYDCYFEPGELLEIHCRSHVSNMGPKTIYCCRAVLSGMEQHVMEEHLRKVDQREVV